MFVCPYVMGNKFSKESYYFRAPAKYKIVINTKNLTLTLYSNNTVVKVYSVAVGKPNNSIPTSNMVLGWRIK